MKRQKIIELLCLFLLSLTPILWLREGKIVLGHDSGLRLNPLAYINELFYSWSANVGFGYDWSIFKGYIITQAPEAFFTYITQSVYLGQLLTFIFWFFLIQISMYTFVNGFYKERRDWFLRVFCSVFYAYNFFLLQGWFIVERGKFSVFAALPLGLLILYKTLVREYSLKKGFFSFALVFFFLNGGGNPSLFGPLIIAYGITFLYITFLQMKKEGAGVFKHSLKVIVTFMTATILVNAYWLFPQAYLFLNVYTSTITSSGGIEGVIAWESVINKHASFINLFRLQGIPDWYSMHHPYAQHFLNNPIFIAAASMPLLIIIVGLIKRNKFSIKDRKDSLFFLCFLLYIIGLLFAAGSHPPTGFLYIFFLKTIPGLAIFRSAFYKFGVLVWFPFIFLVGYFLHLLLSTYIKKKFFLGVARVSGIAVILLFHFPFFSGTFFDWNPPFSTRVSMPIYVQDISAEVNKMPNDTRVLVMPQLDLSFRADSYKWRFFSLDLLPRLTMQRPTIANDALAPNIVSEIYQANLQNDFRAFTRLAGLTGINTILWREDVMYKNTVNDKTKIARQNKFSLFPNISLQKKIGDWALYKIDSSYHTPLIYVPTAVIGVEAEKPSVKDVIEITEGQKNPLFIFNSDGNLQEPNFSTLTSSQIIQAQCVTCKKSDFLSLIGKVDINSTDLFPDSPFYIFSKDAEKKQLDAAKNNIEETIRLDLIFASRKLADINRINMRPRKETSDKIVLDKINTYMFYMNDAVKKTHQLEGIKRNTEFLNVLAYFEAHKRYLNILQERNSYVTEELNKMSLFILDHTSNITRTTWMTTISNEQKYFLDATEGGIYKLQVLGEQPLQVIIDNSKIVDLQKIDLNKGLHRLILVHPQPKYLVNVEQEEMTIKVGNMRKYEVQGLDENGVYEVSFEYRVKQGMGPTFSISERDQDQEAIDFKLARDDIWTPFVYEFAPTLATEKINLLFDVIGFEDDPTILELRNFKVYKIIDARPYLVRNKESVAQDLPEIKYHVVNPTFSIIHVDKANAPFFFQYGQTFKKGWKAYIRPTKSSPYFLEDFFTGVFGKPIDDQYHFTSNSYANSWYINTKGKFDIVVIYRPQVAFYLGIIVGFIGMTTIALALLYRAHRRK